MGTPSGLPEPSQPTQPGATDKTWWIPNAIAMASGIALIGLGVYDRDNQALIVLGSSLLTGAAAHAIGVRSPTP